MKFFTKLYKPTITVFLILAILIQVSMVYAAPGSSGGGALASGASGAAFSASKCIAEFTGISALVGGSEIAGNAKAAIVGIPVYDIHGGTVGVAKNAIQAGQQGSSFLKDCIEHGLATAIEKYLLAQMTQEVVQWINSGFHGDPLFVTNPGQFLADTGDKVVGEFVAGSPLNFLCSPFKLQIQESLILNFSKKYAPQYQPKCSLSSVVKNINSFLTHFNQGGWAGWFSLTLNQTNNIYGTYLSASDQLSAKIGSARGLQLQQLGWGKGFLSFQTCKNSAGQVQSVGFSGQQPGSTQNQAAIQQEMKLYGVDQATAISMLDEVNSNDDQTCTIQTPGATIADQLSTTLGEPIQQLGVADDLDKILNALLNQGFQQFLGAAGGLLGSARNSSGASSADSWVSAVGKNSDAASAQAAKDTNSISSAVKQSEGSKSGGAGVTNGTTTTYPGQNIALNAAVTESSALSGHPASAMTDGNKNHGYNVNGQVTYSGQSTQVENNPWVQVDLGAITSLGKITIYPRSNGTNAANQLNFTVTLLDNNSTQVWQDPKTEKQVFGTTITIPVPNISARYIKIQAQGNGRLEFDQIEAVAYIPPTITLTGGPYLSTSKGQSFIDPGATAQDNVGNDISSNIKVSGTVDTTTVGAYTLTYTVADSNNVTSTTTRTVVVQ